MPMVDPMTAIRPPPPVRESSMMVKLLLTNTLPRRREQRRKLPSFLTGRMALASSCSCSVPVLITICSSVWSRAIRPRLRPEKRPERQRRKQTMTIITHLGRSCKEKAIFLKESQMSISLPRRRIVS